MIRLKISKIDDSTIQLEAVAEYVHHGFGTFLMDIQPEEIECDAFSKEVLLAAKWQRGVYSLEIWELNRLAWGSTTLTVVVPLQEISKEVGADVWLELIQPIN
jgi:hypothetical protein